jgi:hypothetical protein
MAGVVSLSGLSINTSGKNGQETAYHLENEESSEKAS